MDAEVQQALYQQFWKTIPRLRTAHAVSEFFSHLLTDTEEVMLAKRIAVAVLILKGKRPKDIVPAVHVSYSMVRSVSSWLKNANPNTKMLLEKAIHDHKWDDLMDTIDSILDSLPPTPHTDWSRAGQERSKRKISRNSKRALR